MYQLHCCCHLHLWLGGPMKGYFCGCHLQVYISPQRQSKIPALELAASCFVVAATTGDVQCITCIWMRDMLQCANHQCAQHQAQHAFASISNCVTMPSSLLSMHGQVMHLKTAATHRAFCRAHVVTTGRYQGLRKMFTLAGVRCCSA